MFVMTVDQRGSRRDIDRVDELLADTRLSAGVIRAFERTAGDEVQSVVDDPAVVTSIALDLAGRGHWSVGIGVGETDTPLPVSTRAGRGYAFEAARDAVTRAKNSAASIAVTGSNSWSVEAETALTLVALLIARRSEHGRRAVEAMAEGHRTQGEAAAAIGISKQAMSQRLAVAAWQSESAGRRLITTLLHEADA